MSWDPKSGRSPLGLPLPEKTGRQGIPSMDDLARELGGVRDSRGGVEHLCPDCGFATGTIVVQVCRTCGGSGRIPDEQMVRMFGPSGERAVPS